MKLSEESKERIKSALHSFQVKRTYKPSVIKVRCFICKKESANFEVYGSVSASVLFCQDCIESLLQTEDYLHEAKKVDIISLKTKSEAEQLASSCVKKGLRDISYLAPIETTKQIVQNIRDFGIQEIANAAINHFDRYLDEVINRQEKIDMLVQATKTYESYRKEMLKEVEKMGLTLDAVK